MMQKFTISGRLMGRNEFDYVSRSHWSKANEAKKQEQERVIWAMKQAGIAYATEQIVDLYANGIKAVHVYSMNKPEVAEKIQSNLKGIIG